MKRFIVFCLAALMELRSLEAKTNGKNFDKVNLRFYHGHNANIYTKYFNPNITQLLSHESFDLNLPTMIFISGWIQAPYGDTSHQLIDAYIRRGDYNILVLDWSDYSVGLYTQVMFKMSKISRLMGRSITKLFNKGLSDKRLHCVGHSFGAHSCGIIGREVQTFSNEKFKLGRITGLDPAGPNFFPPVYENPLSPQDGDFVDTIQSDNFFIGTSVSLGHVSFYPNNGTVQPGCAPLRLNSFFDFITVWCSHQNAVRYFTDTLNPKYSKIYPSYQCTNYRDFKGGKCQNNPINYMGIDADPNNQGKFYIDIKTQESHDSLELYNFVLGRIGKTILDILRLR